MLMLLHCFSEKMQSQVKGRYFSCGRFRNQKSLTCRKCNFFKTNGVDLRENEWFRERETLFSHIGKEPESRPDLGNLREMNPGTVIFEHAISDENTPRHSFDNLRLGKMARDLT